MTMKWMCDAPAPTMTIKLSQSEKRLGERIRINALMDAKYALSKGERMTLKRLLKKYPTVERRGHAENLRMAAIVRRSIGRAT